MRSASTFFTQFGNRFRASMNIVNGAILLCTYLATAHSSFQQCQRSPSATERNLPLSETDEVGEPLLLTPLIRAGKLDEARNQSRVAPLLDSIESHAGYLTVNETTKSHLYFWYFPTTVATSTPAPLILWLQGGPGMSSLFGLFTENGPFRATKNGTLEKRVHAWTNNYHVLYVDQPVGTGFSFTERDGYVKSQEEVGEHLYVALVQFYQLFSELKNHDLYIAGDGYAGKFIPTIGFKIHTANRDTRAHQLKIPLSGMVIGNGYSDAEYMQDYAQHYHGLGLIDEEGRVKLEAKQKKIKHLIRAEKWFQAVHEVHTLYQDIGKLIDSISMVDYTGDNFFLNYSGYENFVQLDRVRKHLHVGRTKYYLISEKVHLNFLVDMMKTVRPWIEELLAHNYPMLFYSGQFDLLVPPPFVENFLNNLRWRGADQYGSAERRIWRVGDKVAGFYKCGANLVYVLVRNAGAYVPTDEPENALNLIDMFVGKKF